MWNDTADRTMPATLRKTRVDARVDPRKRPAAGHTPVFVDPTARRTRRAMLAAIAIITVCLLYVAVVGATVLTAPVEPDTSTVRPDAPSVVPDTTARP